METTDLTVIILTRGQPQVLSMCLNHLELQTYPAARLEVIVVAFPGATGTSAMLERFCSGGPVRMRCVHAPQENVAAARNLAAMQAQGQWLLFLDETLLAGSHLVEHHIKCQQQNGNNTAAVGRISYHPQLGARMASKALRVAQQTFQPGQPLSFLDWRAQNLSLPRDAVLEAGGFNEDLPFEGLEDLELGYRLERNTGIRGRYCDQAQAFVWKPESLDREVERSYTEGYWLHHLFETTESAQLRERYRGIVSAWRGAMDPIMLPLAHRLCPTLAYNSRAFNALRFRALRSAFRRGYRDANRGRPAILPARHVPDGS